MDLIVNRKRLLIRPIFVGIGLMALVVLAILGGFAFSTPTLSSPVRADGGPSLTIPVDVPALPGSNVTIPVNFTADGQSISSAVFSLDFDETLLTFDPTDSDSNGVPDAVSLNIPSTFAVLISFDQDDIDGELDFIIFDPSPPFSVLPDGALAFIEFTTANVSETAVAEVNFSQDPPPSFGNTSGQSVLGTANNGSILINLETPPTDTPTPTPTNTPTATPSPIDGQFLINLPIVLHDFPPTYFISGRVVDSSNNGIGGVVITTNIGITAVTNNNGYYIFSEFLAGLYSISPSKPGYTFSPASRPITLPPDAVQQDFVAIVTPTPTGQPTPVPTSTPEPPSCDNKVINPGFEDNSGWVIGQNEYPAAYTTAVAKSGNRSMRIGIVNSADNKFSYSSAWQWVTIPSDTASATFSFWLYPVSGEGPLFTPIGFQAPNVIDEVLSSDAQYVLIFDQFGQQDTLLFQRNNDQAWTYYQFDLFQYAGQTIQLYFGVYNDGWDGATGMYVDDVSLDVCQP